jgi:hypothetical protein
VLGAEVGVLEVLGFVEHVFAKQPFEQSGRSNRTDQVEVLGGDRFGQADGVARAVDVGPLLVFGAGLEVVDCGEVKEVLDLALQLVNVGLC